MVATCYRRMGLVDKSFRLYQMIHSMEPESLECLKYRPRSRQDNRQLTVVDYDQVPGVHLQRHEARGTGRRIRQEAGPVNERSKCARPDGATIRTSDDTSRGDGDGDQR